jgi:hypothetical protein
MAMKRKCRHPARQHKVQYDENLRTQAISCGKCGAVGVLALFGVATDDSLDVQHEIAAADIVARLKSGEPHLMTNAENDGFDDIWDSPFADLAAWHIGWLAAEATHDHSDGWAWDVSRPIADQLAEAARSDEAADRLRADLAATAAGEDPVADRLVDELMADDDPDPSMKFDELARQISVPVDHGDVDVILPDEVAS